MRITCFFIATLFSTVMASTPAAAQVRAPTKASDEEPCCSITAIDVSSGIVTAKDKSARSFQFAVSNPALLRTLKVGQKVFADFSSGKVRVHGIDPCCNIVAGVQEESCCSITALNLGTAVVTARENSTGRVFRFEVKDAALLKSLRLNQSIHANFGTSKVRIYGLEPCCAIIGHGPGIR